MTEIENKDNPFQAPSNSNDPLYVFKEIEGDKLEKYTELGWEMYKIIGSDASNHPMFGSYRTRPAYLLRRPREKSQEMVLLEKIKKLEDKFYVVQDNLKTLSEKLPNALQEGLKQCEFEPKIPEPEFNKSMSNKELLEHLSRKELQLSGVREKLRVAGVWLRAIERSYKDSLEHTKSYAKLLNDKE
jgi:hypothetical protein